MVTSTAKNRNPLDLIIAGSLGLITLTIYVRTLAPDLLYSDSGEFQTLAYTLGYTHSTGYPIYLLLARLVGFLPIGNLAWRISLFSAISAAVTISFVFLTAKLFTRNPWGPALGSLALMFSYTYWSQAIIAEVYSPALMFLVVSLWLLLRWQEKPSDRKWELFASAVLIGSGVGVHASVGLLAPAAAILVTWILIQARKSITAVRDILVPAVGGTLVGIAMLFAGFLILDLRDPLSSFYRVMLEPSRSIWNLSPGDIDSPWERTYYTITGLQWRDAMFPEWLDPVEELFKFLSRFTDQEFGFMFFLISVGGGIIGINKRPRSGLFLLLSYLSLLFYILNYQPSDKYVFYLPLYLLCCCAAGSGMGIFIDWLAEKIKLHGKARAWMSFGVFLLFFLWFCSPVLEARWRAVQTGVAGFVKEDYVFPVEALLEPRAVAKLYLYSLPENAVLIMDWRALYATLFIAHVEGKNPGLRVIEATPHGGDGNLANSLVQDLTQYLAGGTPVFANMIFGDMEAHFTVKKVEGSGLYQLFAK
jgi:hypothetical protein